VTQATAIPLTGDDLTLDEVWAIAHGDARAELSGRAREKMAAARALVERVAHGKSEHTYGVNTGFGRFVSTSSSGRDASGCVSTPRIKPR